jgi:hypothetical protein
MKWLILILLLPLVACSGQSSSSAVSEAGTPTFSAYFALPTGSARPSVNTTLNSPAPLLPTLSDYFVTMAPLPTRTPRPTPLPLPTRGPITETPAGDLTGEKPTLQANTDLNGFAQSSIYSDTLAAGWTADQSWGVQVDLKNTAYVHNGDYSIAVTPNEDYGALLLSISPDSAITHTYTETVGVRFWLNAGEAPIYLDQLAATVIGSNAYTYWKPGDNSVQIDEANKFFSETRLYFLGFNRELPPKKWLEVVIWLDDLPFEPNYTYLTGFYIKNDAGFRNTFYVDDVSLVTLPTQ